MSESRWRTRAARVIDEAVKDHLNEHGLPDDYLEILNDFGACELLRKVRAAYPFGERRGWPYKAWLKEVALLKARWTPAPAPPTAEPKPGPAGQERLLFPEETHR